MNPDSGSLKSKLALCAPGPLFRGTWPDGVKIVCHHCAAILAEGVAEDQIWDITFICFECQAETDSPSLPAGMALPPGTVYVPPGSYGVGGTLEVKTAVVIGERAMLQYKRERNEFKPLFKESPPRLADGDLQMVVSKQIESIVRWMVPALDKIVASDRRATKSVTPPIRRHPLAETISHAQDALRSLATDSPTVHAGALCELGMMCDLLEHWGSHPLWPKLAKAFVSEYSHSLVMLSTASLLG